MHNMTRLTGCCRCLAISCGVGGLVSVCRQQREPTKCVTDRNQTDAAVAAVMDAWHAAIAVLTILSSEVSSAAG